MLTNSFLSLLGGVIAELLTAIALMYYLNAEKRSPLNEDGSINRKNIIMITVLFGFAAIVTSRFFSFTWDTARVNITDFVTLVAGLIGGPVAGIGSGLILGADRYLVDGFNSLPCMLAPIVSGLVGGLIWQFGGRRFPKTRVAAAAMIVCVLLHMGLVLSMSASVDAGMKTVQEIAFIQFDFNLLTMVCFALVYNTYIGKRYSGQEKT